MSSSDLIIDYNINLKYNNKNKNVSKLNSKVLGWENSPVNIEAINTGVVVNLPSILVDFNVKFNFSSSFELSYEVSYIEKVINKIKIKKCTFMQGANVIFIEGILNKQIYYNTFRPINVIGALGDEHIKNIQVPFEFAISIKTKKEFFLPSKVKKASILEENKENIIITTTKFYYNLPYCEIDSCEILSSKDNILINKVPCVRMPLGVKEMINIENIVTVKMKIKLLKNVDVYIPTNK
ncbi:MAG: hypothetical protein FH753_11590 [Firmicutes bacterium]|nr:hypothetical protein [Bacillota bacterium]